MSAATADIWPKCATYPRLECVCRGGLGQNVSTCTRKRTGNLTPLATAAHHDISPRTCRGEREETSDE